MCAGPVACVTADERLQRRRDIRQGNNLLALLQVYIMSSFPFLFSVHLLCCLSSLFWLQVSLSVGLGICVSILCLSLAVFLIFLLCPIRLRQVIPLLPDIHGSIFWQGVLLKV